MPEPFRPAAVLTSVALALGGCATAPTDSAESAEAARATADVARVASVAAAAAAAAASQTRPFADVIKEAKESKGYFTLWQKDEKVWIEIAPDQFDKPM